LFPISKIFLFFEEISDSGKKTFLNLDNGKLKPKFDDLELKRF
jgi:hypothetical protein